jgi:hypothetical protein
MKRNKSITAKSAMNNTKEVVNSPGRGGMFVRIEKIESRKDREIGGVRK